MMSVMNDSMIRSVLAGVCTGCLSGWITRLVLRKFLAADSGSFFAAWGIGMLSRLMLTLAVFLILYLVDWPHPFAFILALIMAQTGMQVVPLKPH